MKNLIDAMTEKFVLLEKTRTEDGEGGWNTSWVESLTFDAAVTYDTSMQSLIAESAGVTSRWTITTKRSITLDYHDVIRNVKTGRIFRVTSDANDKKSPTFSTLDMAQCSAEEWVLP